MSSIEWLADKSALVWLGESPDAELWAARVRRALIRVSTPTLLEVGYAAGSMGEWAAMTGGVPVSLMPVEYCTPRAERRAVEVQGLLARRGQHRAPSIPDLLIAAIAETAGLTVLHVDKDFDLIAEVTGQSVERLMIEP